MKNQNTPVVYPPEILLQIDSTLNVMAQTAPDISDASPLTARRIIAISLDRIETLTAKGYSLKAIHRNLADTGVDVAFVTFKSYLSAARVKARKSLDVETVTPLDTPPVTKKSRAVKSETGKYPTEQSLERVTLVTPTVPRGDGFSTPIVDASSAY